MHENPGYQNLPKCLLLLQVEGLSHPNIPPPLFYLNVSLHNLSAFAPWIVGVNLAKLAAKTVCPAFMVTLGVLEHPVSAK